jgi:mannose-1-phosphate guanylyltransferase
MSTSKTSGGRVKAVLLCAGLGSRLRPLTDTMPKCLVPVGGRPLMDYWFDNLNEAGIEDVVVNTHWLPEVVEEYLAARGDLLPRVKTLFEAELLGSGGTLAECADWASDADIVVSLYGDLLVTQKISSVVAFHRTHEFPFTLSVAHADEPWRRGIATVGEGDIVTDFVEKPPNPTSDLAAAGMYAMSPDVLMEMVALRDELGLPLDLGTHVIPRLVNRMKAYYAEGVIHDIGTFEAYAEAQELAKRLGMNR